MRTSLWILLAGVLGAGVMFFYLAFGPHAPVPSTTSALQAPLHAGAEPALTAPAAPPLVSALPVVADPATVAAAPSALLLPVEGVTAAQLIDTFNQARPGEVRHEALDILAPKGTKVLAVADGKIAKLFTSKPGGLTVYQFDAGEKFSYYYAHLDGYAPGLAEGSVVKRGDLIGYVGSSGNADAATPHLHFAIFELEPAKQWWKGQPLNPYTLLRPAH